MKTVKNVVFLFIMALSLTFTACEEDSETLNIVGKISRPTKEKPGGFTDQPGALPAPKITEKMYIPEYDLWDHTRCIAWRIEWPEYPADVNPDMIPDFFSSEYGEVYSFNFLTRTDQSNKAQMDFSLYHGNMIRSSWYNFELWPWYEDYLAESPRFKKIDRSLSSIEHWVTERPDRFEKFWPSDESPPSEVSYQAGDFFLFHLGKANRYGGIRIVSETPRIIEIYYTEPNI